MRKEAALVVLSGGQDSTTTLFWAKQQFEQVHAITFNYGQRHALELQAAEKVARMAGVVTHEVVNVPKILGGTSPLVSDAPLETYQSYEEMDEIIGNRVELTFVPLRNPFFLIVAANRAVCLGAKHLITGVCEMDNANYPDCRESFILAMEATIRQALGTNDFYIHAPLLFKSKADTVRMSKELPGCWEAMAYSHTCYAGEYPPCGKCHSCQLRAHGFKEAGLEDPLVVRSRAEV